MSTTSQPTATSVCAIVVAFFPDHDFERRIQNVLPQVGGIVIVYNTPHGGSCNSWIGRIGIDGSSVEIIENKSNLGVATALNQGLNRALERGFKWILTLDQDSLCYSDIVQTLLEVYLNSEPIPGIVGANYFDPQSGRLKVKACAAGSYVEQKTVITSGSLINAEMARAIGGFRDDYFIDQLTTSFAYACACAAAASSSAVSP